MLRRFSQSPRHATIVAYLALFVALAGTSAFAASKINGRSIAKRSIPGNRLKPGQVGTREVAGLLARDFRRGQLRAGPQGPHGAQGPQGPAGPSGIAAGAAGGDLSGTYPNPVIGAGKVTVDKIGTVPSVAVTQGVDQPGNGTPLQFGLEIYDESNMHAAGGDNTRLVAPVSGIYQVSASTLWSSAPDGFVQISIRKNGSAFLARSFLPANSSPNLTIVDFSQPLKLAAGDYLQLIPDEYTTGTPQVITTSPSNASPFFGMYWVAPR